MATTVRVGTFVDGVQDSLPAVLKTSHKQLPTDFGGRRRGRPEAIGYSDLDTAILSLLPNRD
jgi:hypothetical protein